ncbi:MAG TPA: NADP-dependent isocitrate dehydrogenase [Saprospiraceae bacterium]|nr:NADP-dependent isocitrate dehydrogenase [Saprospiraceae bacterium]
MVYLNDNTMNTPITIARGDGIGPEIMDATLRILHAAKARIDVHEIEIGEKVYHQGHTSGIRPDDCKTLRDTRIFLKAPITTPSGGGYKSLNVTIRKTLGLFANVRPCQALHPFVPTRFPDIDMVIIRENEEDLYAGIEHRQTQDVTQCLKLITRPGTEKIMHYAFEYAKADGRQKVTCMAKDNIMKITDGLFHRVFDEIGVNYPKIEKEYKIIDIGSALLADRPHDFDVVVTENLYGDIISDIVALISGSVGMAGSANIGESFAMFEAIHGSAPDISGQGIANPSGLLNGAIMMLTHIGQGDIAATIKNAWLKTLEDGIHTGDIYREEISTKRVGTREFADAVIANLGKKPKTLTPAVVGESKGGIKIPSFRREVEHKELVGVDVFLDWRQGNADDLGHILTSLPLRHLKLKMITNRGVKVYPDGLPETFCTDHWRCRFVSRHAQFGTIEPDYREIPFDGILELLHVANASGLDVIKTENLYEFDNKRGFSLGQGE